MKKEIPKIYEPQKHEDKIYKLWEKSGFFNPDNLKGEPYSIMMPPPNVTGILHLGHALENTLMDTMARFQRLRKRKVLLLPGTDHAAVATQAKVEQILVSKGIKNPRQELGRKKLLREIRNYAEKSKKTILKQIRKMGTSCDWSRLAYTLDEARSRAVNAVFQKMYEDGLIYRGFRAVNWSTKGQSTLSDDEIIYVERKAKLYTFKYSKNFPFTIATTRPETKLGDTAVAVNPKDERYKKYIGKEFDVNFVGQKLHLLIIAERGVEMAFGTGAVGVTPAHSMADYEMAVKNNLPIIKVIGEDGKITKEAKNYAGLDILEARKKIVENLKKAGLLEKVEEIKQNAGTSDRFLDIVEVLPQIQWFINVNKKVPGRNQTLKDLMRQAVAKGHKGMAEQKIRIAPKRFEKIYYTWIDNLRDWCISRQIWWGHRIPVYYRKPGIPNSHEEIYVGAKPPKGNGWEQDPDTLDTWFSSALWTFSTLGWPLLTKDLKIFHPTNWMQMGHEILFFWMARMVLMSTYALDEIPFKDVYIHGILRDERGRKFSKSLGNTIDPLDVKAKYGTDALRFGLLFNVSPGQDQRFYFEKVEGARNFVNKLWNIGRYIITNTNRESEARPRPRAPTKNLTLADKWILARLHTTIKEVTDDLENFRFSSASLKLRDFTWSEFADWYIEISKIEKNYNELLNVYKQLLKLWHPFIPFVTEALWQFKDKKDLLMLADWPEADKRKINQRALSSFRLVQNIITGLRNLRAQYNIETSKKIPVVIYGGTKVKLLKEQEHLIKGLAGISKLTLGASGDRPRQSASAVISGVLIYVPLAGLIEIGKEKQRITKEKENTRQYIKGLENKLKNKQFLSKAPKEVVQAEKEKLLGARDKLKKLKRQLKNLISPR